MSFSLAEYICRQALPSRKGNGADPSQSGTDVAPDDTLADDTLADDTLEDDTLADDTLADDTLADHTLEDDTLVTLVEDQDRSTTLHTLSAQLDGLRAEWDVLTACVSELRTLLSPADFNEALVACGLDSLPGCATVGNPNPQTDAPSGNADPTGCDVLDGLENADELTVNRRLVEVLAMIKKNLESSSHPDVSNVAVPADLTTAIARQVADEIRESLHENGYRCETTRGKNGAVESSYWTNVDGQGPQRRIPLDDVEAVIDELTGNA